MAKYKILVIAHLLKNNQVGKFGETVDESQLTSNPNELVKAGFIEPVIETEIAEEIEVIEPVIEKKTKTKKK